MGLVKANAYGHGLVPVAKFLCKAGCQELGCAHVGEARLLRKAGICAPILLLSSFLESELDEILKLGLVITLSSREEKEMVERAAKRLKHRAMVQVKMDTGMGRLGMAPQDIKPFVYDVLHNPRFELRGIFTHYACADCDQNFTRKQWRLFEEARPQGYRHHSCNSAAALALPEAHGNCVRPGLCVYGISPIAKFQKLFRPALTWKSRVVFVKEVSKGSTLSYGATYRASKAMRVATVAVGYGDGLFRLLSNRGKVLIQGKRCKILGCVTMDQILVDVTKIKNVRKGNEVVLLGEQGKEKILTSEMARWAETISYEIWTHITERVPRIYLQS